MFSKIKEWGGIVALKYRNLKRYALKKLHAWTGYSRFEINEEVTERMSMAMTINDTPATTQEEVEAGLSKVDALASYIVLEMSKGQVAIPRLIAHRAILEKLNRRSNNNRYKTAIKAINSNLESRRFLDEDGNETGRIEVFTAKRVTLDEMSAALVALDLKGLLPLVSDFMLTEEIKIVSEAIIHTALK